MKRAIIVHGWASHSRDSWFPWIKKELESKGFQVSIPNLPFPRFPLIPLWTHALRACVGTVDQDTVFIGHSIGCQAILRFLATQSHPAKGAVFVAGFFTLNKPESWIKKKIIAHWLHQPLDLDKLQKLLPDSTAIFSDNDRRIPLDENRRAFKKNLGSKILIDHNKKHFAGKQGITELPSALNATLDLFHD